MEIAVILSGEHKTLPPSEVKNLLEAENAKYRIKYHRDKLMTLEVQADKIPTLSRLAYTHEISQIISKTTPENLDKTIKSIPWERLIEGDFAVRAKKIEKIPIDSPIIEKKVGAMIKEGHPHFQVNLENPRTLIRLIIEKDKIFITKRLYKIDKKHFNSAKPHKRPFFYPGSMSPKLARCMVNLSGVREGERLLDPFCGTGGILIEAGIIGVKVIGADIDPKMIKGAEENLKYYGIRDYELIRADARSLKLEKPVKAIVTDPPYGISASTQGEKQEKLYREFLKTAKYNLQEDGRICIATPHYLQLENITDEFKIKEKHAIRMHKSLTRIIYTLEKSGGSYHCK
ncbi:MAG TPA: TIGR01177 family methyltransferase [Methanothermobacter sp.]|jgi:tRNA (guanine10-N2)-dimethyltransferase|uniref:tRNA (Guanine-N2)-dimethyltransferase n=1 Tax=Methanothermobacter tenebrarum TaxID=680118 RepID=A0ABM7YD56_9EURY|nr:TIGR01177 family methyltransferase [Methanothermobacter tenebrarum]MDD3455032.1 TIGR01177 family methyltransferase [Methanobacteriales archaeon]MDI6881630.1 TIGR01177 family methyltransferase [Methanothermobacter sp.]MDX9693528.1 TIGR01177 family methyltransferase [Methanothermobacter sp.]BDH79399.1 tRNA (guanine-N2)-dimethyltransferase [Methanothermobacter tenebrarum]HHW16080.1 TIGR01177 family methyltransferase [Methanothermobacter sp.]